MSPGCWVVLSVEVNHWEMCAFVVLLDSFGNCFRDKFVVVESDGMSDCRCVRDLTQSTALDSPPHAALTRQFLGLCVRLSCPVIIPGVDNVRAEHLTVSRLATRHLGILRREIAAECQFFKQAIWAWSHFIRKNRKDHGAHFAAVGVLLRVHRTARGRGQAGHQHHAHGAARMQVHAEGVSQRPACIAQAASVPLQARPPGQVRPLHHVLLG